MIAFRRLQTDAAGDTTAQLILVGSDGSNPTPLTDGTSVDQDPIFSPDGTELAFKSNRLNAAGTRDNQFWVIGRDGSGLRELGVGSPGSADGAPAWGHR
jgi:Tol biopolymer transport system component